MELRTAYTNPVFLNEYIELRNSPPVTGETHVEFALALQSKILPKYGFDASVLGVMDMRNNVSTFSYNDPVLLKLLHDVHLLLDARQPLPVPETWSFKHGWRPTDVEIPKDGPDAAQLVQTMRDSGDRLSLKKSVLFESDFAFSGTVVDVGLRGTDQEIIGFGGAFTEASAHVFQGLPTELQQEVLELYFGDRGIGYTTGRLHINSCDFSLGNYSFDDVDDDFTLAHFDTKVVRDSKTIIPLVKAARKMVLEACGREMRLLASPWSPPAWMKTSGKMNGSSAPGLRAKCRPAWANYFAKWITAYKAHGIPIWAVTAQNEPEHPAKWEACVYNSEQEADFIGSELGPTLRALHPEVAIFAYDHNKDHLEKWAGVTYAHPTASKFVTGVAFHWYSGDGFDQVLQVHQRFPRAVLLSTEICYERRRWSPNATLEEGEWSFGEGYAHEILGDLNAGTAGWIDWNLLLDESGGPNHVGNLCDAPLRADLPAGQLHIHPQYFFIGHFSKYILPGSRRLITMVDRTITYDGPTRMYGTCTTEDGLQATSFLRPDGIAATVVLNSTDASVKFKLRVGKRALRCKAPPHAAQTYLFACNLR